MLGESTLNLLIYAIGTVYGGVLVWLVKRLLGFEKSTAERRSVVNERLAIISTNQSNLEDRMEAVDKRNTDDHERIEKLLHDHHRNVTGRLDGIVAAIRNGGPKP